MIRTIARVFVFGCVSSVCVCGPASAQSLAVRIPQPPDTLFATLPTPLPPLAHEDGMWSPVQAWDLNPIHMVVLPDGSVATFGAQVGDKSGPSHGLVYDIWKPRRGFGAAAHRRFDNAASVDSFCAASTVLSTGQVLTSGGRIAPDNMKTALLNGATSSATQGVVMEFPRYYATQTALPNGDVLVTGGSISSDTTYSFLDPANAFFTTTTIAVTPEVITPGPGGGRRSLSGAVLFDQEPTQIGSVNYYDDDAFGPGDNRWWYPRQWVAPNGLVFGISARQMWYLDTSGTGTLTLSGLLTTARFHDAPAPNIGASSTAVMYDKGKILQVGGNGRHDANEASYEDNTPSSWLATKINIDNGMAVVSPAASLPGNQGRQWANATVLPDGRVLVTGGSTFANREANAVREAALWDPAADQWTSGASASVNVARGYHSSAVLLPNGTVLTGGGGNVANHEGKLNVEVYYPPYLFQASGGGSTLAPRPRVLSMNRLKFIPGTPDAGTIQAEVNGGHTIVKAALVGLGSTTHGFDMGQRLYPVSGSDLTVSGSYVSFTVPNHNYTPPGYYLLVVTNDIGVPSEGVIVAIGSQVTRPPPHSEVTVDLDGDRSTDLTIFRPSENRWWVRLTAGGNLTREWGTATDVPRIMDYDGDDKGDIAVWRPSDGHWHILTSSTQHNPKLEANELWGQSGDIPVPADYDGDGRTDLAVWRVSASDPERYQWLIRDTRTGFQAPTRVWGQPGDLPHPMDYDGDGAADLAVWRVEAGEGWWHITTSSTNYSDHQKYKWGVPGDILVPADYDGDGRTDLAVWRASASDPERYEWWILDSRTGVQAPTRVWGKPGDLPRPIDYDGDGAADLAIWRPGSPAYWWILKSSNNYSLTGYETHEWGKSGDIPIGDIF